VRIDRFHMERTQSLYENEVEYNLSESGVQPLTVAELLGDELDAAALGAIGLKYAESNGSALLRERIATFYPGATRDNVLVTTGGSEANYTTLWGLLDADTRAAVMIPNYMQSWGLARAFGQRADPYRLVERSGPEGRRWALDIDSLERAVTRRTRVVFVTNPNNPTGAVLREDEMDAIVQAARRANAWIVSDEIYRGAEVRTDVTTPSFWGRYGKVIVTAGLSKAFGLPGLRIGWIVGPATTVAKLWSYQDYTTLTPGILSDRLARLAMQPARRERILARTRGIIRRNLPRVEAWIAGQGDLLDYVPPVACAIALVKYHAPIGAVRLFERLRLEHSVLITPGAHFGLPGKYIRIGYGYDMDRTLAGLARIGQFFGEFRTSSASNSTARTGVRHFARSATLPSVKRPHVKELV
jgi:aspartate/methionine/tyrosine aminotransferase